MWDMIITIYDELFITSFSDMPFFAVFSFLSIVSRLSFVVNTRLILLVLLRIGGAWPREAGRLRRKILPPSTRISLIVRLFESSLLSFALATADFKSFSTGPADLLARNRRVVRASSTFFPRMRFTVNRAFLGECRRLLSCALTSAIVRDYFAGALFSPAVAATLAA